MVAPENIFPLFVIGGVMITIVCIVGLVGNVGTLVVMSRRSMRSSINCLLLGMVSCDIIFLFTYLLIYGLRGMYPYTGDRGLFYFQFRMCPFIIPILYPIGKAAQTMSVYLTMAVTLERWVAVCHPLHAKSICTYPRARWCVIGTAIFSLVYIAPRFFEYEIVKLEKNNETIYDAILEKNFYTDTYHLVYRHWIYTIVMYVVPFTVLLVFNTCILLQVKRARAKRAEMSGVQRKEIRLAIMLLVIVVVFFLCNMLPLIRSTVHIFGLLRGNEPLIYTSDLLLTLNHAVNFVIYAIFSENFRKAFMDIFCASKQKNEAKPPQFGAKQKPSTKSNESLQSKLSNTNENFVLVEQ